jgi:hypothetical protein
MPRLKRSGVIRVVALFLLLTGGSLSTLEFVLHSGAGHAESSYHLGTTGSRITPHHCLGTAMSGAGVTPVVDARTLLSCPDGLETPVRSEAALLAFAPAVLPTTRAPPTIPV